jgi:hypothetical protein
MISPNTVAAIRSKQASRLLLAKEAEMVRHMVDEGLLTETHAEAFLSEITEDTQRIEKARNQLYRYFCLLSGFFIGLLLKIFVASCAVLSFDNDGKGACRGKVKE